MNIADPFYVFLYIVAVIGGIGVGIGTAIGGGVLVFSIFEWLSRKID